mmetsp:Transcript_10070/g.23712  ORF Transcript_10070/g.23712 Transcript_10070/m.23712 type:complete len:301 (-) Transcript_10070:43-945(-)
MPSVRILGVGLMKAGSTVVIQALRAALLWTMGFDCNPEKVAVAAVVRRVMRREDSLHMLLEICAHRIFGYQLAKDQTLTPLAERLFAVWPAISSHAGPLHLYFVVRSPFGFIVSMLHRLDLKVGRSLPTEQHFRVETVPDSFPRDFQIYLDTTADGLNFTGFVDALIQRWALVVDVYLRCPRMFALVRYEDFKQDPVLSTRLLLLSLGQGHQWSSDAAARVAEASAERYQSWGQSRQQKSMEESLGRPLLHRIWEALGGRAKRLGYGDLEQQLSLVPGGDEGLWLTPVDVPPLPERECSM